MQIYLHRNIFRGFQYLTTKSVTNSIFLTGRKKKEFPQYNKNQLMNIKKWNKIFTKIKRQQKEITSTINSNPSNITNFENDTAQSRL